MSTTKATTANALLYPRKEEAPSVLNGPPVESPSKQSMVKKQEVKKDEPKAPTEIQELVKKIHEKIFALKQEERRVKREIEGVRIALKSLCGKDMLEEEEAEEKNVCPICYERPVKVALVPCGHTRCEECAQTELKIEKCCAVCKDTVESTLKVYIK